MKLTKNDVEYVANLARLKFKEEDVEKFSKQLSEILLYIDKLNEIDTSNVEPMAHAVNITNAFRDDEVCRTWLKEDALSNAPDKDEDFFKVPRII